MRISMFLLKIYGHLLRCYTKTIHPCIVLATSFGVPKHRFSDRMSVVLNSIEFFIYEKLEVQKCLRTDISERWHPCRFWKFSPYHFRQDGGGSKQNRVRTANSQLKNEHGRSFFSVPAGVFFLRLESAPPIFKKADSKIAVGVSNVFDFFLS